MLQIPEPVWKIVNQNKGFEGIKPTPNPKPNPDGSRTVKLTPAQWNIFQENQKKQPGLKESAPEVKDKPGSKSEEEPAKKPFARKKEKAPAQLVLDNILAKKDRAFFVELQNC